MFTREEMREINMLCEKDELFAKYISKYKEENEKQQAYVYHELGNQLTLINSTAQLMESRNPELHEIKYWDQLRNDIETMRELFLSFSQYRHCSQMESQETDLIDLADEIVESFQPVAVEKKVSVILEENEELDMTLLSYVCDSMKIRQVMVNLIKNALEAVTAGEKIWVRVLGAEKTNSDYIRIEIANNGELIEKEALNTIFDFGISSKGESRGIGLAFAKKVIKAHNGELTVSSEEINGERETVFTIYLPV